MSDHSFLSPSGAERWFNCAGVVNLMRTLPKSAFKTSKAAAEGSVAHARGEDVLLGRLDLLTLTSMIGDEVMHEGHKVEITDAMVDGVAEYIDYVTRTRAMLRKPATVVAKVEVKVHAKTLDDELWGTADYLLYQKGNELHVFDFKFGYGLVEAEENKQGMIYLIGAQDSEAGEAFDKVFFHIVQPRAPHADGPSRSWELPKGRLTEFRKELEAAIKRTKDPQAPREAGKWCKFCPGLGYCPEAGAAVQRAAQTTFTAIPAPPSKEVGQMSLPPISVLNGEQMGRALDWEDSIDSWFNAVRERALDELIKNPMAIPGYKLVEGRANREWRGDLAVEEFFDSKLGPKAYESKLKSPNQMEKVAGKELVAQYVFKPQGRLTVAKSSDKRTAVTSPAELAQDVFKPIGVDVAKAEPTDDEIFGDLLGAPSQRKPWWP